MESLPAGPNPQELLPPEGAVDVLQRPEEIAQQQPDAVQLTPEQEAAWSDITANYDDTAEEPVNAAPAPAPVRPARPAPAPPAPAPGSPGTPPRPAAPPAPRPAPARPPAPAPVVPPATAPNTPPSPANPITPPNPNNPPVPPSQSRSTRRPPRPARQAAPPQPGHHSGGGPDPFTPDKLNMHVGDFSRDVRSAERDYAAERGNQETTRGGLGGILKKIWHGNYAKEFLQLKRQREARHQMLDGREATDVNFEQMRGGDATQAKADTLDRIAEMALHNPDLLSDDEQVTTLTRVVKDANGQPLYEQNGKVKREENIPGGAQLEDALKGAVRRFALDPQMSIDDLREVANQAVNTFAKHRQKADRDLGLSMAHNIVEVAKNARAMMNHATGIQNARQKFERMLDLANVGHAEARAGVGGDHVSAAERVMDKLNRWGLSNVLGEATVAAAVSGAFLAVKLGQSTAEKALLAGGAVGLGAVVGGAREFGRLRKERRSFAREYASGRRQSGETAGDTKRKRESKIEASMYNMESARVLQAGLDEVTTLFNSLVDVDPNNPNNIRVKREVTKGELEKAMNSVAEARIRWQMTNTRRNLIRYSNPANISAEKKALMVGLAQARTNLNVILSNNRIASDQVLMAANVRMYTPGAERRLGRRGPDQLGAVTRNLDDALVGYETGTRRAVEGDMHAKDRAFLWYSVRRSGWVGVRNMAIGGAVAAGVQEVTAAFNSNVQGAFEQPDGQGRQTVIANIVNHFRERTGNGTHLTPVNAHAAVNVPDGYRMDNTGGKWELVGPNHKPVDSNMTFTHDGHLSEHTREALRKQGFDLTSKPQPTTFDAPPHTGTSMTPGQYLKTHQHQFTHVHRSWDTNDTPTVFDKNEQGLDLGGINGTGIDNHGNFVFDLHHMTAGGSYQGDMHDNVQELLRQGKAGVQLSVSDGTQSHVILVRANANGIVTFNKDDVAGALTNSHGHLEVTGAYAEAVAIGDKGADGVQNVHVLATVVGSNSVQNIPDMVPGGTEPGTLTLTTLTPPQAQVPVELPVGVPIYGRRGVAYAERNGGQQAPASSAGSPYVPGPLGRPNLQPTPSGVPTQPGPTPSGGNPPGPNSRGGVLRRGQPTPDDYVARIANSRFASPVGLFQVPGAEARHNLADDDRNRVDALLHRYFDEPEDRGGARLTHDERAAEAVRGAEAELRQAGRDDLADIVQELGGNLVHVRHIAHPDWAMGNKDWAQLGPQVTSFSGNPPVPGNVQPQPANANRRPRPASGHRGFASEGVHPRTDPETGDTYPGDDAYFVADDAIGAFDGIGLHERSYLGSRAAAKAVEEDLAGLPNMNLTRETAEQQVRRALIAGNNAVLWVENGATDNEDRAGTTAVVMRPYVSENGRGMMAVGSLGDSRGYVYSNGRLRQVTVDDDMGIGLVREAFILQKGWTPQEARQNDARIRAKLFKFQGELANMPEYTNATRNEWVAFLTRYGVPPGFSQRPERFIGASNVLTNSLGREGLTEGNIMVRTGPFDDGDLAFAFSDGVMKNLRDREIADIIGQGLSDGWDVQQITAEIVRRAAAAPKTTPGSNDDITAVGMAAQAVPALAPGGAPTPPGGTPPAPIPVPVPPQPTPPAPVPVNGQPAPNGATASTGSGAGEAQAQPGEDLLGNLSESDRNDLFEVLRDAYYGALARGARDEEAVSDAVASAAGYFGDSMGGSNSDLADAVQRLADRYGSELLPYVLDFNNPIAMTPEIRERLHAVDPVMWPEVSSDNDVPNYLAELERLLAEPDEAESNGGGAQGREARRRRPEALSRLDDPSGVLDTARSTDSRNKVRWEVDADGTVRPSFAGEDLSTISNLPFKGLPEEYNDPDAQRKAVEYLKHQSNWHDDEIAYEMASGEAREANDHVAADLLLLASLAPDFFDRQAMTGEAVPTNSDAGAAPESGGQASEGVQGPDAAEQGRQRRQKEQEVYPELLEAGVDPEALRVAWNYLNQQFGVEDDTEALNRAIEAAGSAAAVTSVLGTIRDDPELRAKRPKEHQPKPPGGRNGRGQPPNGGASRLQQSRRGGQQGGNGDDGDQTGSGDDQQDQSNSRAPRTRDGVGATATESGQVPPRTPTRGGRAGAYLIPPTEPVTPQTIGAAGSGDGVADREVNTRARNNTGAGQTGPAKPESENGASAEQTGNQLAADVVKLPFPNLPESAGVDRNDPQVQEDVMDVVLSAFQAAARGGDIADRALRFEILSNLLENEQDKDIRGVLNILSAHPEMTDRLVEEIRSQAPESGE